MKITRMACTIAIFSCAFGVVQAGTLTPINDAPGADPFSTNPLGINDVGQVGGGYTTGGGVIEHGFVGPPTGPYTTFDYSTTAFVVAITEVRALNNAGDAVGYGSVAGGGRPSSLHEFLRTPSGTIITLTDPSTGNPLLGIGQGINSAGYIVGDYNTPSGSRGFILSPDRTMLTTLSDPLGARLTRARGINDSGTVTGFFSDANGIVHGFVYDGVSGHYTTLDDPLAFEGTSTTGIGGTYLTGINNAGEIAGQYGDANGHYHGFVVDASHTQFTEIHAPGAVNTQVFGINNLGQVTVASDSGGFVWSPATTGTPTDVFLPLATAHGAFQFQFGVSPNVTYYIDPKVALGYDYRVGAGNPNFAAVTPPSIGGGKFELWVCKSSHHCSDTGIVSTGGSAFSFLANGWPTGISEFKLVGIKSSAKINPNNQTAFITGVDFVAAGHFTGTMTPLCGDDGGSELEACTEE
jgi:hypothetical protein